MNNVIYQDEMDSLVNGLSNLAELPIEINDTPAEQLTPAKIRSELRKIKSKRGELGLVVLDYIQKLAGSPHLILYKMYLTEVILYDLFFKTNGISLI